MIENKTEKWLRANGFVKKGTQNRIQYWIKRKSKEHAKTLIDPTKAVKKEKPSHCDQFLRKDNVDLQDRLDHANMVNGTLNTMLDQKNAEIKEIKSKLNKKLEKPTGIIILELINDLHKIALQEQNEALIDQVKSFKRNLNIYRIALFIILALQLAAYFIK